MRYLRIFAIVAASLPFAFSVEPGKPSRTAVLTLQMRALGTKVPDPELRNPDALALKLFGAREREVLSQVGQPIFADLNFTDAWNKLGGQRGVFIHVLARTRAIDDTVRAALKEGARQVVILGAGYDSRAYRMQEQMRGTNVFEVDFPPTQELKKLRIRESLGRAPSNVVFVPIDFTKEDLQTVLPKAGYHSDRKTVFVWEGVSFYLPEPDITATLRFVAKHSAPGSTIVFDYESERVINGNHDDTRLKEAIIRLAKWGEPHIFGLPDGKTREFLKERGLTLVSDLRSTDLTRLYLTQGTELSSPRNPGTSASALRVYQNSLRTSAAGYATRATSGSAACAITVELPVTRTLTHNETVRRG